MQVFIRYCAVACILAFVCLYAPQVRAAQEKVALLTHHALDDRGFYANIGTALEKAHKEQDVDVAILVQEDSEELENAFMQALKDGYQVIFTAGTAAQTLLMNHAGNYRKQQFVAIDAYVNAPNIASVIFADAESAFTCGYAAALYLMKKYPETTPVLGFVGSFDIAPQRYIRDAFQDGARYAMAGARVVTAFANSTTDQEAGYKAAQNLYSQGVKIVMHATGTSGLGVIKAAQANKGLVIGFGQDQHALAPENVLISCGRNVASAINDCITAGKAKTFPGGKSLDMRLANKGVFVSPLNAALAGADYDAISKKIQQCQQDIINKVIIIKMPRKRWCNCN